MIQSRRIILLYITMMNTLFSWCFHLPSPYWFDSLNFVKQKSLKLWKRGHRDCCSRTGSQQPARWRTIDEATIPRRLWNFCFQDSSRDIYSSPDIIIIHKTFFINQSLNRDQKLPSSFLPQPFCKDIFVILIFLLTSTKDWESNLNFIYKIKLMTISKENVFANYLSIVPGKLWINRSILEYLFPIWS